MPKTSWRFLSALSNEARVRMIKRSDDDSEIYLHAAKYAWLKQHRRIMTSRMDSELLLFKQRVGLP